MGMCQIRKVVAISGGDVKHHGRSRGIGLFLELGSRARLEAAETAPKVFPRVTSHQRHRFTRALVNHSREREGPHRQTLFMHRAKPKGSKNSPILESNRGAGPLISDGNTEGHEEEDHEGGECWLIHGGAGIKKGSSWQSGRGRAGEPKKVVIGS